MKKNDAIVEILMMWLTDLSVLRNKLNLISQRFKKLKTTLTPSGSIENYLDFSQQLQKADKKLAGIEKRMYLSQHKCMNELHHPDETHWITSDNQGELFDYMQMAHSLVINLQRSLYMLSTHTGTKALTQDTNKVISLSNTARMPVQEQG